MGAPGSPYRYMSLGIEMIAPIVLFLFAGYMLDEWIGSSPWFLLGGALLGIVVSFYNLYRRFAS